MTVWRLVWRYCEIYGPRATFQRILLRLGLCSGYHRWIKAHERALSRPFAEDEAGLGTPLFSVVVPVFDPPRTTLAAMVRSVRKQTYPHWELIMVDAACRRPWVRRQLTFWPKKDQRIRVLHLESNRGIAENTNAGLAMAHGDWVGFLDHDDTLAPFSLASVVRYVRDHSDVEVLYSDEDKLTPWTRQRINPFLKPDWSPETFLSYNYLCHFLVIKRTLGTHVGWLRPDLVGAQDYDFILRVTEKVNHVAHIPQVLYHWRMCRGSTARRPEAKRYAYGNAQKALLEHLRRQGTSAHIESGLSLGTYRVRYCCHPSPLVSIVIPSRDRPELLSACARSLLERTAYPRFEVLVAENGSTHETTFSLYRELRTDPRVRIVPWEGPGPFNFSALNNDTVRRHARGDLLLFLNNDTEAIDSTWLEALVEHAVNPSVGAVGAKLVYPDGTLQHGGIVVGIGGFAGHPFKGSRPGASGVYSVLIVNRNVSAVTGACLMVRRETFDQVGGFDPDFSVAGNDVDFCLRLMDAGYRNVWTPYATLIHHESRSRGYETTPQCRARYEREVALFRCRWRQFLSRGDPCYNPGLSLNSEDWSLAGCPRARTDVEGWRL